MKIETNEKGTIVLSDVFNSILLKARKETQDNIETDEISICQRDGGFEVNYHGNRVDFKWGSIKVIMDSVTLEKGPGELETNCPS